MFCPNCGTNNTEGAAFCRDCGKPLAAAPQQTAAQPVPVQQTAAPNAYSLPRFRQTPIQNAIRAMASSKIFLAAIIAYTLSGLLSMVFTLSGGVNEMVIESLKEIMKMAGLSQYEIRSALNEVSEVYSSMDGMYSLSSLSSFAPYIIWTVGLWMIFWAGKNSENYPMSTTGLTIFKVMMIINLVSGGLGLILVVIALLFLVIMAAALEEAVVVAAAMFVVFLIIFVLIFGLAFAMYGAYLHMINSAIKGIRNGATMVKFTGVMSVLHYLSGVTSALSALVLLFWPAASWIGLSSLASAAATFLFGMVISAYGKKIAEINMPVIPMIPPANNYRNPQQ